MNDRLPRELVEKEKLERQIMALRAAKEFQDGDVVNLGYGVPTLAANFIPAGREVLFHSENGVLGFGEITLPGEGSPHLINASGQTLHPQPGMSFFSHDESFNMIRGGHVDLTVLGAYEVSEKGDLANYMIPEKKVGLIGGGMDLAVGAKRVVSVMNHVTKKGEYRIRNKWTYPLTSIKGVDLIVTDIAVIPVMDKGLVLKEVAPG